MCAKLCCSPVDVILKILPVTFCILKNIPNSRLSPEGNINGLKNGSKNPNTLLFPVSSTSTFLAVDWFSTPTWAGGSEVIILQK